MRRKMNELRFVAVEFPDDPNVVGYTYWYLCDDAADVGDKVAAPLGRHNRLQTGVVRRVRYAVAEEAPYPVYAIKKIASVEKKK